MVSGGYGTCDGCLLLIIGKALSGVVSTSALRDLDDDGGLNIPVDVVSRFLLELKELTWQPRGQRLRSKTT
jgi:hypothetical protein